MGNKMFPSSESMGFDAALARSLKLSSQEGCFKTVKPVWPLEIIRWAAKKSGAPATGVLCAFSWFVYRDGTRLTNRNPSFYFRLYHLGARDASHDSFRLSSPCRLLTAMAGDGYL